MRSIRILAALIVLGSAGAVAYIYSGAFDVAASSPEPEWRGRLLAFVKDRAIDRHVETMEAMHAAPPPLADEAMVRTGLVHFHEMCVGCHGAPGVPRSETGVGLNPPAPDLAAVVAAATPNRLYWVLKNGIKMTGMPAFGATHTEAQLWAMVAFLRALPKLDPAGYAAMVKEAGLEGEGGAAHEAAPATPLAPAAPPPPPTPPTAAGPAKK